jgi:hypothetical protein
MIFQSLYQFLEKNKKKPNCGRWRVGPDGQLTPPVSQTETREEDDRWFLTVDKESGEEGGTIVLLSSSRVEWCS